VAKSPCSRFGQRFGERLSEVQAKRRLERSRNATSAAVPLTEAQRDCVFYSPSATGARYAAAERALVAAGDIWLSHFIFTLCGNRTGIAFSFGKLMS